MKRVTIAMLLALIAVSGASTWVPTENIGAHLDDAGQRTLA